jgi:hypothetical protein
MGFLQIRKHQPKSEMQTWFTGFVRRAAAWLTAGVSLAAFAQAGRFGSGMVEDATLTQYDGDRIVARVHVDRVFPDYEKLGFFRVSLFPLAVIEGARAQVFSAAYLTNAIERMNSLNRSARGARHVELRQLEICLFDEKDPRLRAAQARIKSPGVLELSGMRLRDSSNTIAKATLQISGSAAGHLRWRDGEKEIDLFVLQPPEKTKP